MSACRSHLTVEEVWIPGKEARVQADDYRYRREGHENGCRGQM